MQRLKRLFPLLLAAFVLVALFAPKAWRAMTPGYDASRLVTPAQAAALFAAGNTLTVERGSATVRRADGASETVTDEALMGVGDAVTVSEDGFATLRWFDDSVSRLSGGAELRISAADYDPEEISETHVEFEVVKGAVWSKAMNLVDADSTFEGRAGDVVAGVRGTAFNLSVTDGSVLVQPVEHALALREDGGTERVVVAGESARFAHGRAGALASMRLSATDPADAKSDWFLKNEALDGQAIAGLASAMRERLRQRVGALPGESDWDKKERALAEALSASSGAARVRAQAAIASMRVFEFALRARAGTAVAADAEGVLTGIEAAVAQVKGSDLPEPEKRSLIAAMVAETKAADRALADALPEDASAYAARLKVREMARALVLDQEERERLIELYQRHNLFELGDSLKHGWTDACECKAEIEEYRQRSLTDKGFRRMFELFLADIRAKCPGSDAAKIRFAPVASPKAATIAPAAIPAPVQEPAPPKDPYAQPSAGSSGYPY
ncbi:hypothetical protein EPO34_00590 [Patescibacteria group bacterium]|nr:MAG: hypothetical protein EPO34_00590 [Patescibacteria group bacterium]